MQKEDVSPLQQDRQNKQCISNKLMSNGRGLLPNNIMHQSIIYLSNFNNQHIKK